jgi:hypothetical protein
MRDRKSGLKLITPALNPTKRLNPVPQASAAYSDQLKLIGRFAAAPIVVIGDW